MSKFDTYLEMAVSPDRVYKSSASSRWNSIIDKVEDAIDNEIKLGSHDSSKKDIVIKLRMDKVFKSHSAMDKQAIEHELYNKYFDRINSELKKRYIRNGWLDLKAEDSDEGVIYTLTK